MRVDFPLFCIESSCRWPPPKLSHYFDKSREMVLRETVIPTVEQLYKAWIAETRSTVKMKNGHGDFVLPMFEARHSTHVKNKSRMSYLCCEVNEILRRNH